MCVFGSVCVGMLNALLLYRRLVAVFSQCKVVPTVRNSRGHSACTAGNGDPVHLSHAIISRVAQ